MALTPVPVSGFGGLDLASSPDDSACIDSLNVDLDVRGALRSRDGFVDFTSSAASQPYVALHTRPDGDVVALRSNGTSTTALDGISSAGAVQASQSLTAAADIASFTDVGTVAASYTYVANFVDQLKRWDGSAWASPGNAPVALCLATQPVEGRLVAGFINTVPTGSTATANGSLVHFSDAGAPDTWTATNWVNLAPGDGDTIRAMVAWRELLFIFKRRKFFVFYGNSVDATGGTVFNYRTVDTGVGATTAGRTRLAVAAPDAVYFVAPDNRIYRTTGGPPVPISGPVDPLLQDRQGPFSQADAVSTLYGFTYADGRIILAYSGANGNRQLVYDIQGDYWLYWNLPATAFAWNTVTSAQRYPIYFASSATNDISKIDVQATTDDGTAITSRYRTGFTDLGQPGQEKDIQSTRMWGTGTIAVKGSRDFGSLDSATNVTLGTSPAIATALHNKQKKGELISYEFSSVDGGAWALHRYAHLFRGQPRPAGERSA